MKNQQGIEYSRYRLILISALICFTGIVGYALWSSYSSQIQVRNAARELFAGGSAKRAMAVSSFFSNRALELKTLSSNEDVQKLVVEKDRYIAGYASVTPDILKRVCNVFYKTISEKNTGKEQIYSQIILLDSDGRMLIDTDSECVFMGENSEYKRYLVTGSDIAYSAGESDGVMALVMGVPVIGAGGEIGTVVAWIRIEALHDNLKDIFTSPVAGSDFLRAGEAIVAISDMSARNSAQLLLMDALKEWKGLTVLSNAKSDRKLDYLATSSPVYGTSMSIISLVKEQRIFGFLSLRMHLFISLFIFMAVASCCYSIVRIIFNRHIYETRILEAAKREAAVSREKEKLEQEIKSRRLADALRKRAEIRYRDIFDNAPVGIFQITMDGGYLTVNNAYANILGYDDQEEFIISVTDMRTDVLVNSDGWDAELRRLNLSGKVSGYIVQCYRRDRTKIWLSCDFRLVEGEPGLSSYLEGFAIDITSRKKAERELISSEKRFRSLFENSPVALWEMDFSALKDTFDIYGEKNTKLLRDDLLGNMDDVAECVSLVKVLDTNNLAIKFLSVHTREELIERGFSAYVTARGWRFFRTILLDFASGKVRHRSDVHLFRKDGREQFFIINCIIVPGYEKTWGRVLATVEDISELKHVENELRISNDKAQKANEAKGHFLANMSHEFRTPMNAIKGMVQLLQGSKLDEDQQENLRLIKSSVDSLLVIVNDILDFSKYDTVHMELSEENADLPAFLKEMRDVMDIGARNKKLEVLLETENIPSCVKVDLLRVRQVLVNLLGNAVKFTNEGEVTLKCRSLSHPVPGEKVEILFEVSDTGIGLPVQGAESLFKSFVQADPSITRQYGGTGLGLAICNRLVKHLGGELSARNNAKGGATFTFTLYLEVCSAEIDEGQQNFVLDKVAPDYSGIKVLVAEDSKMNQILLRKIFDKNGVTDYIIVGNGKEAVDLIKKSDDFDIVFMDIQMPVMDGLDATTAIRNFHSTVRIVALTANSGADFIEQCIKSGMDSRIVKPFNVEELLAELNVAVELSNSPDKVSG
ncbi:ATP-binding protein [Maridesulfovibrio zosterae]|uniref:ATP-binding protein n=1 Tax=Maridesulfovibrio zosterae TaxID=82171 RepID=UPI0004857EBE|nr:ATP-binding protein [Maridesulfovibrio zosterae]